MTKNQAFQKMPGKSRHFAKCPFTQFACNIHTVRRTRQSQPYPYYVVGLAIDTREIYKLTQKTTTEFNLLFTPGCLNIGH